METILALIGVSIVAAITILRLNRQHRARLDLLRRLRDLTSRGAATVAWESGWAVGYDLGVADGESQAGLGQAQGGETCS